MGLLVEGDKGAACDVDPVGDITIAESAFIVPWFSLVIAPHLSCLKTENSTSLQNASVVILRALHRAVILSLNVVFGVPEAMYKKLNTHKSKLVFKLRL